MWILKSAWVPQKSKNSSSSNKGNNNNKNQATGILLGIALITEVNLKTWNFNIEYCVWILHIPWIYIYTLHIQRILYIPPFIRSLSISLNNVLLLLFSHSVVNSCDPMDSSMLGSPVLHHPSLLKLMSTELVMASNHLSLYCPLLLPRL